MSFGYGFALKDGERYRLVRLNGNSVMEQIVTRLALKVLYEKKFQIAPGRHSFEWQYVGPTLSALSGAESNQKMQKKQETYRIQGAW